MKNNFDELFDENAKQLFQNFEMDFNPQDWDKIQRQLDKSDEKFDAHARQKLENLQMPYNKQDWAIMETLLDKRRQRLAYFAWYKSIEIGFVALFLFGTLFLAGEKSQTSQKENLAFNNSNTEKANSNTEKANSNTEKANSNTEKANSNAEKASSNAEKASSNAEKASSNAKKASSNTEKASSNAKKASSNTEKANSNTKKQISDLDVRTANTENRTAQIAELILLKNADIINKINPNNGDEDEKNTAASLKRVKLALPFVRQLRLAGLAGMEMHSENSFGRGTASFLGGFMLEMDINRYFALSFGLQYARRNHELELNSQEISPEGLIFNKKELRNTHLSLVQIPLLLQTNLFRNQKWRVYLNSGINANLILDKTYSGTLQINSSQTAGNMRMQTNLNPREYEAGLFQTGNFKQNAFLTAQIGVGAERQLSDHFSLFVQPTYQFSLTRFGTNQRDKTRVVSLNVGLKTNF